MIQPTRLVAILGGGDWADASVDFLSIPFDITLKEAKVEYDKWYREGDRKRWTEEEYMSFPNWLRKNYGALEAAYEEIEVFNENEE